MKGSELKNSSVEKVENGRVFVTNFSNKVSRSDMDRLFSKIGKVESVQITAGKGRKMLAWITFKDPKHIDLAIKAYDNADPLNNRMRWTVRRDQNKNS